MREFGFHEQGLGKTKIAIDLLTYWISNNIVDTVLVVTKKSLVSNWVDEFAKHSNFNPKVMSNSKNNYPAFNGPFRVLLTNFETVYSEKERFLLLLEIRKVGIIVDESAKIKNPESKLTKTFFELAPYFERRCIMTGTPVANRPYDIWSQIYFLDKGASLGTDYKEFKRNADLTNDLFLTSSAQIVFENNIAEISNKISSFSVRETKSSGIIHLPPKEYYSIEVDFDEGQKKTYGEIRKSCSNLVDLNGNIVDDSELLSRMLRLIQVTSNPKLVNRSYAGIPPKIAVLENLVKMIVEREEKVIVWTMFLENVDMIKEHLSAYNPVEISGRMDVGDRKKSVDKFINDANAKVLVATSAAKEGLTLTVANNAIFYDRSLSLDDYLQAQDRIHRISQNKSCNIYNLKIKGSIDEWIDALLESKAVAAKLSQGDISKEEYEKCMDYSFGEIVKNILGVNYGI